MINQQTRKSFWFYNKENPPSELDGFNKWSGLVLLSHTLSHAVPSAQKVLTSVFEMGTGVTLSLSRPEL